MSRRARRLGRVGRDARGYVLAEALVSAALASLAGVLSVTLLIWSAQTIDRAQSSVGAMRALERLYEEARLATPDALARPASGVLGRYRWTRVPGRPPTAAGDFAADPTLAYAPLPVRFVVDWTAGGRKERRQLLALVRPAGRAP